MDEPDWAEEHGYAHYRCWNCGAPSTATASRSVAAKRGKPAKRMMNVDALDQDLTSDEGLRLFVYDDATGLPIRPGTLVKGHPSIGIGRALDIHGISKAEAQSLLDNDTKPLAAELAQKLAWFGSLNDARQRVLAEMAFQLGVNGLLEFGALITACASGNFVRAAVAMLASKWATQTPTRARRLADRMRTGA